MTRRAEPRITNLATETRRAVSLRVAAKYLDIDVRTLGKWLDSGVLPFVMRGHRRKVEVSALADYEQQARQRRA